jgi:hypothetical protein
VASNMDSQFGLNCPSNTTDLSPVCRDYPIIN